MSKRGGFPGGMGGFGGMNINNLMKEAKKMQAEIQKSQEELATKEFDSTAGGGAISVKVTGEKSDDLLRNKGGKQDGRAAAAGYAPFRRGGAGGAGLYAH